MQNCKHSHFKDVYSYGFALFLSCVGGFKTVFKVRASGICRIHSLPGKKCSYEWIWKVARLAETDKNKHFRLPRFEIESSVWIHEEWNRWLIGAGGILPLLGKKVLDHLKSRWKSAWNWFLSSTWVHMYFASGKPWSLHTLYSSRKKLLMGFKSTFHVYTCCVSPVHMFHFQNRFSLNFVSAGK